MFPRLFAVALCAALSLAGCQSTSNPFDAWVKAGVASDATTLRAAAIAFEGMIANAARNGGKAVSADAQAIVTNPQPFAQLIIEMDNLAQAAARSGLFPNPPPALSLAVNVLHALATDPALVTLANTGQLPASPMLVATSIINTAAQIKSATTGTLQPVTPTTSAAQAS